MTTATTTPVQTDEEAVRDTLRQAMAAWAENDADAFTSFYAEDVSVVLAGGLFYRDRAGIRDYMAEGFAGPMKGSTAVDVPEHVRIVGGDTAIVVSRSGYKLPQESEASPERLRRATWVLTKQDGRWLVQSYHNCPIA